MTNISQFCELLKLAGRSPNTLKAWRFMLIRITKELGSLDTITASQIMDWINSHEWSRGTLRIWRICLHRYYVHNGRPEFIPSFWPAPKPLTYQPRPINETSLKTILDIAPPRTRLMILLGATCGLRRAEIACIHSNDVIEDLLGISLLVHGKGGKPRVVPVIDGGLAYYLRNFGPGWLFPSTKGDHHITPARVGELIKAVLPTGEVPHGLRHRFGTVTYAGSRDLLSVSVLMGHASPSTTKGYIKLATDTLRESAKYAAI